MIIGSNQVMERSNLISRFTNEDFDGDSLIALALHSEQARNDFKYAYVRNIVEFEHMDELLIDYEHESIFSAYMLTLKSKEDEENWKAKDELSLLDETFNLLQFKETPGKLFKYKEFNRILNRVEAAINYTLMEPFFKHNPKSDLIKEPFYTIEQDGLLTKKNLGRLTEKFWDKVQAFNKAQGFELLNFWDIIHELDKFFLECSATLDFCSPSFDLKDFVIKNDSIQKFKENLLTVEPFLAFHQNLLLFEKVSDEISKQPDNILNLVFKSGARLKSVQLLKAASNTGIPTDIYGKAFPANIKNSLLDGLTPEEYFIASDSARLALAVRQEAIPKGGELQRKFFFTVGILKLDRDVYDCETDKYYEIKIRNKNHLKLLNHRWFYNEETQQEELIDTNDKSLIGKVIKLRSPVTCKNENYKICQKCFGEKHPESVNLGSTVGAALSEGIIQSVLRAHHFGGAFIAHENKKLLEILRRSDFKGPDTIIVKEHSDLEFITDYLKTIYDEEDINLTVTEQDGYIEIKIEVINMPFNDDSVKALNNIVGLIDKNRDESSMIPPDELYEQLAHVIEENGILSVYLELIISLLYYDEDGILYRYTEKPLKSQTALKNIIEVLDPKLSIFYNFSNRIISKIYNHTSIGHIDHMYHDLLEIYR